MAGATNGISGAARRSWVISPNAARPPTLRAAVRPGLPDALGETPASPTGLAGAGGAGPDEFRGLTERGGPRGEPNGSVDAYPALPESRMAR
ncbi:hypothetical protein AB0I22_01335 [Streptomyces sp. NPDC050610]|uniref:hypothetical protein n=1 Tax=Streptomyces sp. NPDC050610 TaxID=3157097 RepID=UPI0034315634